MLCNKSGDLFWEEKQWIQRKPTWKSSQTVTQTVMKKPTATPTFFNLYTDSICKLFANCLCFKHFTEKLKFYLWLFDVHKVSICITVLQISGIIKNMKHKKHKHLLMNNSLPSSPPDIEKSFDKSVHFWIFWALDVALALTRSIPSWMIL